MQFFTPNFAKMLYTWRLFAISELEAPCAISWSASSSRLGSGTQQPAWPHA